MPLSAAFHCPDLLFAVMHFLFHFLLLEFFRFILGPFLCRVDPFLLKVRLENGHLCRADVLEVLHFLSLHPFRLSLFLANVIYRAGSVFSCVQFIAACDTLLKSAKDSSDLSLLQKFLVLFCIIILFYIHLTVIINIFIMFDHVQFALFTVFWVLFTSDRKGRRTFTLVKLDGITLLRTIGLDELVWTEREKVGRKWRKHTEETEEGTEDDDAWTEEGRTLSDQRDGLASEMEGMRGTDQKDGLASEMEGKRPSDRRDRLLGRY